MAGRIASGRMLRRDFLGGCAAGATLPAWPDAALAAARRVTIDDSEAEAALRVIAAPSAERPARLAELQATKGFKRLADRERSFNLTLTVDQFDPLWNAATPQSLAGFQAALARAKAVDVASVTKRPLAYLPAGSTLAATVYFVIKPRTNSFAYDSKGDAALFIYVHPEYSTKRFADTLAHELFHIGFEQNCPSPEVQAAVDRLEPGKRRLFDWLSGFGEGFAALAAAGGPDVDPASAAPAAAEPEWRKAESVYGEQMQDLTRFFRGLLTGELSGEAAETAGDRFLGVQGPWYTVGWRQAVTIERAFGRPVLVECIADQRRLLSAYNRAAAKAGQPQWPADVAGALTLA